MDPERKTIRHRPRPRPAPRGRWLLVALVVLLAVLAFVQARLLVPWLLGRRSGPGPRIEEVNLPERVIRVFLSEEDPALLLKTPMDLPEANERQAEDLDRALFPGGERHRYWILHVRHEGDASLDFAPGDLVATGRDGSTWRPVDLASAVAARADAIPPYLRVWLRLRLPGSRELRLHPDGGRQLLLALPADAAPEEIATVRIGGRDLLPRKMPKDELDRRLDRRDDDGATEEP